MEKFCPSNPYLYSRGTSPIWSRWACVRTTASTFPAQGAVVLNDFGLNAKAYSSKDICLKKSEAVNFFKDIFGKDYDELIDNIDIGSFIYFHKRAKKEKIFSVRKNSLKNFEKYLEKKYIVIPSIDWNILHHKKGPFQGHAVTVMKMNRNHVWINDPDEGQNIKYSRKLFNKAYTVPAIDNDVLVVYGKIND